MPRPLLTLGAAQLGDAFFKVIDNGKVLILEVLNLILAAQLLQVCVNPKVEI